MSLSGVYVTPLPSYLLCISAKCCSNHLCRRLDINRVSCLACVSAVTSHPWPNITQQHKFHLDQAGTQHCIYATSATAHCGACDSSGGFCWLWEDRCQLSCHTIMSETGTQCVVQSAKEKLPLQRKANVIEWEELAQCFGSHGRGCSAPKPDFYLLMCHPESCWPLSMEHIISAAERGLLPCYAN